MTAESTVVSHAKFDPLNLAAQILREVRTGMLATIELESGGGPMATLVTVALDQDGVPLIFISALSAHTENLISDPRFSLLLAVQGKGDPLAHPRLTLTGSAYLTDDEAAKARFVEQNPKSRLYADFPDFTLWRLEPRMIHLNGGFARAFSGDAGPLLAYLQKNVAQQK